MKHFWSAAWCNSAALLISEPGATVTSGRNHSLQPARSVSCLLHRTFGVVHVNDDNNPGLRA